MVTGAGGGWSWLLRNQNGDGEMDVIGSVSPFHSVQVLAPGMVALSIQDGLSLLSYISLKAPSQTCQEVRLLVIYRSSHADHKDGDHMLHLCYGDSSKSTSFWSHLGCSASNFHRRASWARYAWYFLLILFPLVTEHVWCRKLRISLSFFALMVLLMEPGGLTS